MITRWKTYGAILVATLVCVCGPVLAQDAPDPILKFEGQSEIELDLGIMVDDLLPQLLATLEADREEDVQALRLLIDLMGLESLDRLHMVSDTKKDESFGRITLTLDKDAEGGLLADLLAVPDKKCDFAKYVTHDELVAFQTIHNFAGHLALLLDLPKRPELAEMTAEIPRNEDGDIALPGFVPRTDLLPLLSGELDMLILDLPEGGLVNPMEFPVFLVLGTKDGFGLRDLILDLAVAFGGEQAMGAVEMIRSLPPEQVGDFELTTTPFGGAYAVSKDYFILGMTGDPLQKMLAKPAGDLHVPDGCSWSYMNGEKYGEFMRAMTEFTSAFEPGNAPGDFEQEIMNRMYTDLFEHVESEVTHTTSSRHRLVTEVEVKGSFMAGLYGLLRGVVADLPEIVAHQQAQQAEREVQAEYNGIIAVLDGALTQYGIDHDGLYPADPTELVSAGYLEEFPLDTVTPLGVHVEGAYTYVTLLDAEGRVAGYYLFVYGGEEDSGFDVFTPDNLQGVGNFVVDSDGFADGVASFCYDGLALQQMEIWHGQ